MIVLLCTVSVVAGMHAELESKTNVSQTEHSIVSMWIQIPADKEDQLRDSLRSFGADVKLVLMKRGNSIALYFICMTLAALMSLRDQYQSGQLRDILQSLFTFLLRAHQKTHVKRVRRTFQSVRSFFSGTKQTVGVSRVIWLQNDYIRCLNFVSSVQGL